jgi:hypothetical protein
MSLGSFPIRSAPSTDFGANGQQVTCPSGKKLVAHGLGRGFMQKGSKW